MLFSLFVAITVVGFSSKIAIVMFLGDPAFGARTNVYALEVR